MKSGPKNKDLTKFVRFGNLDHNKKQDKKFRESGTFHAAPSNRGFYAFPKIRQEFFLIGCLRITQPKGQIGEFKSEKNSKDIYRNIRKEFSKTRGTIWHHLGDYCKIIEVLDRQGSWVRTDMSVWRKAFNKCCVEERYGHGEWSTNNINQTRGINGWYSGDHFEVFIDEKV